MNRAPRELPLAGDPSSRFLPWIVCFMVYLAGLALAAVMFISHAGGQWQSGLTNTLTAQIMPPGDISDRTAQVREFDIRTEAALKVLRASGSVYSAKLVPETKVRKLVEPWLGPGGVLPDLPMPRLIDVRLVPGAKADIEQLARTLASSVNGATLDNHGAWLARLQTVAYAVEGVALTVLVVISLAAILTVVFTTKTGLSIHSDVIQVLHLAGAQDSYVARQFQAHAMRLALKGGLLGGAAAAGTLAGLQYVSRDIDTALLPAFELEYVQWAAIAIPTLAAGFIGAATARVTVLRILRTMP